MTPDLLLAFDDIEPTFAARPVWCGRGSAVIGRASLGAQAWLGDESVIRADGHDVVVGDRFWLGARSTLHIAAEVYPCIVGDRVTVGRDAVVHACTVGDDCVIEDACVVLDGSLIEDGVLLEAGSTVFPRTTLSAGFVCAGSPARPVRALEPGELAERAERLREAAAAEAVAGQPEDFAPDPAVFVARTARLHGRVGLSPGASVFFSCILDATAGPIVVGANVNVQDNCALHTRGGGLAIGRDTTLGHNVLAVDGRIGSGCLIGMGARLGPGTVVEDDVLVAAGSATDPGQVLASGWLWGGRPARPLARLDADRRAMMARTVASYAAYGRAYRKLQARAG
ncbi:gamma carbonic anhydrase family protein [Methylobacterium nonmethylotrophicum]|uniref:Gamma carbonic anhydrase family protein n=1 Tax=Methylobacterium nonmethylotrophicum TaxID=1141884 RepID=A0A4Z0NSR4_9HYPH|nr:gamma carbonic anhydrase family protein [Methylobacterium nonmethylotrophicum]TGE00312.1 gamma carbonic anhydrase family protein [Methylobacterium nonmethylotrophicum]